MLFTTSYLTLAGLEAMADLQLRAPDDFAVVSFDDHPHFQFFRLLLLPWRSRCRPSQKQ
ncbi:hypothetical protein MKQ70_32775 [Chitinophaga sedimenti]|uniref:hypothetical protein n=1 Tax=Chitinophaga sedimenti TaxID=2033606 RepID=UPI0020046F6F|nr:hypothetical protein [Chitinophaga sedimenti]MCK7559490.1 hypothetical protein [Chitinophaga sedimenti]